MAQPVLFLSAASLDLKAWRDSLHTAFSRAGFQVLTQEQSLHSALGDVRRLLAETLERADCVIHLAGMAYGSHATAPFPAAPGFRCSWTQFEYYHAHELGKDVIAFGCAPDLSAAFTEEGESAQDLAYKAALQQAHRDRVQTGQFTGTPLEGKAPRTSNETIANPGHLLSAVAAAVGTLHTLDREACQRARQELEDLAATLGRVEQRQKKTHRVLLGAVGMIALIGTGIGWLMHRGEATHHEVTEVHKEVTEIKNVNAKERKLMALILARANQRIKEWEHMAPAQRFDLALDEIAAEQKTPAKELRDLLDLYVARVEADPDAEAEDKYYVLMRKQAFTEAAELAGKESAGAEARMKAHASKRKAAEAISQREAEAERAEMKRAIDFHQKQGQALADAVKYEEALAAYEAATKLVDKNADPVGWAEAQAAVTFLDYFLTRYDHAEPLMKEIIGVRERQLGPQHPKLATALNDLAALYLDTNRAVEAEPLFKRALEIDEKSQGPDHPAVALKLNNLAQIYKTTSRLAEAEPLMQRALKIDEKSFGPEHPAVALCLNNLAALYHDTNRLVEAESLMKRALHIYEKSFGPEHPAVASALNNLSSLYQATNRLVEAESLRQRALKIYEKSYGPEHPAFALLLNNLAELYRITNRLAEAEPLYKRALEIDEKKLGPEHPKVASILNNLAGLYQATNRLAEAEPLFKRALQIDEKSYGPEHPDVAIPLNNLATLYYKTNRSAEAEPLFKRALKIIEKSYGPEHPQVASALKNLAELYRTTNRLREAEPLFKRALQNYEKSSAPEHPDVATTLNGLAQLYQATNRLAEAEPLFKRALQIDEKTYGPEHPNVAIRLNNLAVLYQVMNRLTDAEPLMRRALVIPLVFQKKTGQYLPSVRALFFMNYLRITRQMKLPDTECHSRLEEEQKKAGLDAAAFEALWQEVLAASYNCPWQVTITEVIPGGQGESLGLKAGDVYLRYNGVQVTSVEQFLQLIGEAKGDDVPVEVKRGDAVLKLSAKPGKFGTRIENRRPAPMK